MCMCVRARVCALAGARTRVRGAALMYVKACASRMGAHACALAGGGGVLHSPTTHVD